MKILLFIFFSLFFIPIHSVFSEELNLGNIYFENEIVSSNSFVKIIVEDNDMNKKEYPNFADHFTIDVWSESSPLPIEMKVVETGVYSGIFSGKIFVSDIQSEGKKLFAIPGDLIYASYVDSTVPQSSTPSEIVTAAVVKISGNNMSEYLEKIDPSMRPMQESLIPAWIKNNAGWWAEDAIDDQSFIQGIEFLIKQGIIEIPSTEQENNSNSDVIPSWIKNNAGWWANGAISETEFVNGIEHMMKMGLISVDSYLEKDETISSESHNVDSNLDVFEKQLEECSKITIAYKRIDCEKPIKKEMNLYLYQTNAQAFEMGPITYYWLGIGSEGNEFEVTQTGQAILSIRMLAENTSSEVVALNCTSPQICNYDVWDGTKSFKYSGMDFTSGQIVINPGDTREFNILFGPNIGYGGTEFEYDPAKDYVFRISEPWGSGDISLDLKK